MVRCSASGNAGGGLVGGRTVLVQFHAEVVVSTMSKCLALAKVSLAVLYRSYPHLKAEFEQQFARQREAGQAPTA
jgi:hypothetical protein